MVLSTTPCFNPICFAQSPTLLTYIHGPKGEALYLPIESSTLGNIHSFNSFLLWANQIGSLQNKKEKKVGLVKHPQGKRVYERCANPNPLTPRFTTTTG